MKKEIKLPINQCSWCWKEIPLYKTYCNANCSNQHLRKRMELERLQKEVTDIKKTRTDRW